MAFRDFLRAPQETPTQQCEEPLCGRANAFLPYTRNDVVQDQFTGGEGPGFASGTDLSSPRTVERPDFDKLLGTGNQGASPTSHRHLLWEIWGRVSGPSSSASEPPSRSSRCAPPASRRS